MSAPRRGAGETLADWLAAEGFADAGAGALADLARVRELLIAAARERRSVSYSELLAALGFRFSRPKMRALCKTLGAIDRAGALRGEPELAVLVVRESDRLPGQGWWVEAAAAAGYAGPWTGAPAAGFVAARQEAAWDYWERAESARNASAANDLSVQGGADMDVSKGPVIERIARVLAGQRLSANADGDVRSASVEVDGAWQDYVDDALAVLRTLREPDATMAEAGDVAVWERMILAALGEAR